MSFVVQLGDGREHRVHRDQVHMCTLDQALPSDLVPEPEVTGESTEEFPIPSIERISLHPWLMLR